MRKRAGWQQAIEDGGLWTAAQAQEALDAWERSGETVVSFARRHGLAATRLYWWRQRLKKEAAVQDSEPRLIPVMVRRPTVEVPHTNIAVIDGELRIEVGEADAVSPAWVASLLRMMREGRS